MTGTAVKSNIRKAVFAFGLITVSFTFSVDSAFAQGPWDIGVRQYFVYDTNPLTRSGGDDSLYGSETEAFLSYDKIGAGKLWGADLALRRGQFEDSEYNTTDVYLDADYLRETAKSSLGFITGVDYDTTRTGEETALGTQTTVGRRFAWSINPTYKYNLSQRLQGGLTAAWSENRYDSSGLTDYRTYSLSPSAVYSLSPLQSVSVSLLARRYKPIEDDSRSVDSIGPSLGWQYNFQPNFVFAASAGFLGTRYDGYTGVDDNWENNPVYSVGLTHEGNSSKTSVSVTRQRQAYATGAESDVTSVKGENKFYINELLSVNVKAMYEKSEETDVPANNLDSALEESLGLNYKVGQQWAMSLSQRYRKETYINGNGDANRNVIRLGLTYNFQPAE